MHNKVKHDMDMLWNCRDIIMLDDDDDVKPTL